MIRITLACRVSLVRPFTSVGEMFEIMKRMRLTTYIWIVHVWLNSTWLLLEWNADWMCLTDVAYRLVMTRSLSESVFYRPTFPDFSPIGWWGRLGYWRPRGSVSRVRAHKTIADIAFMALPWAPESGDASFI